MELTQCVAPGCMKKFKQKRFPVAAVDGDSTNAGKRRIWVISNGLIPELRGWLCHRCNLKASKGQPAPTECQSSGYSLLEHAAKHSNASSALKAIRNIPELMELITCEVMGRMDQELKDVASRKFPSVLRGSITPENIAMFTDDVLHEMVTRTPTFSSMIKRALKHDNCEKQMLIYSIVANNRVKELCQVKKAFSLLLAAHGGTSVLCDALIPYGLTACCDSRLGAMDLLGEGFISKNLGDYVKTGNRIATISDNLNISVHREAQNTGQSTTQHNWIYWWVRGLPVQIPLPPQTSLNPLPVADQFLLSPDETGKLVDVYAILVAQVLQDCLPRLRIKERWAPKQIISKELKDALWSEDTRFWPMPVEMMDQMKVGDCTKFLEKSTEKLDSIYKEAGVPMEINIPSYGDQLTRRNCDLAQGMRQDVEERVGGLRVQSPFLCAPWHTKQDLLEKVYKLLFSEETARSYGTLANLKYVLNWSRVVGKVKGKFRPHHEFFMLMVKSTICSAAMFHLGMSSFDEVKFIDDVVSVSKEIVKRYLFSSVLSDKKDSDLLSRDDLPSTMLEHSYAADKADQVTEDGWHSYYRCLGNFGLQYIILCNTAAEGDISRYVLNTKRNLELFLSYNIKSKYATEMIDSLYKIMFLLDAEISKSALAGLYVKTNGVIKEVDLETEIHINKVKMMISSLGANKENERAPPSLI